MVVAKTAATEVTNYYNHGNEVKVVVENVGLWKECRGRERRRGGARWSEVAPYLRQNRGHWVLAPRGGGRDGAPSTMSSQVDLATAGEFVNPNHVLAFRNFCLAPRPPLVSSSIAVDTVVDPQSHAPSSSPTVVGIAALPPPPQPWTGDSDAPLPPSALMWLRHSTYFGISSLQC